MNAVAPKHAANLGRLTPKERECLRYVLENWSSKEIGRHLGISHTSVDTHIRRARAKLGLRDRYDAARLVADWEKDSVPPSDPDAYGLAAEVSEAPEAPAVTPAIQFRIPPLATLGAGPRVVLVLLVATVLALILALGARMVSAL